jgi:ubiquinone biosynthesis protein UbiJ
MADSRVAGLSLNDVRASVKRAQTEGRKLVTRLRKDATSMVNRPPLDVLSDARKRAGKTFEELDVQQRRVRTFVAGRLTGLASQVATRVGLASAHDVADLKRRLGELERRLERVTKHQAA